MTSSPDSSPEAYAAPLAFLYNPCEVAVCDPDGLFGDDFSEELVDALADDFRVGLVRDVAPETAPLTGEKAARLYHASGRSLLSFPRGHYGAPLIQPLIELDFVVLRDDADGFRPKVCIVGDGPPPDRNNVLAYVYESTACPILPKSAPRFDRKDLHALAGHLVEALRIQALETPVFGMVMAGGLGTRIQRDKASIDFHGAPQARHCFELLSGHLSHVFVSAREDQRDSEALAQLPFLADRFTGFGPMGGILSAFTAYPRAAWCVVACDLPFVDDATIAFLLENRNPLRTATAFQAPNGRPEPLCAIYEPKSVFPLLRSMAEGAYGLHRLLSDTAANFLEPPDPKALTNVNTVEELDAVIREIASERSPSAS